MFATLVGASRNTPAHTAIFRDLVQFAEQRGFVPGDRALRVAPDQIPLSGWSLELQGPATGDAEFLLAVTAPRVPSIAPIPVRQTVAAPLFAVIVTEDFFGIWREGREFTEVQDIAEVKHAFSDFLDGIENCKKGHARETAHD
jgi:hypothetical protein